MAVERWGPCTVVQYQYIRACILPRVLEGTLPSPIMSRTADLQRLLVGLQLKARGNCCSQNNGTATDA